MAGWLTPGDLERLVTSAGFSGQPVSIAACGPDGEVIGLVQGTWPDGIAASADDLFYGASLTKQLTGAAIAILALGGTLDVDAPLARYLPALPAWSLTVSLRQLLHHTAGLPEAGALERSPPDAHWTNGRALSHLANLATLPFKPGEAHCYSNLGYICLARVVEACSGLTFAQFVAGKIAAPLGLDDFAVWEGGMDLPYRQAAGLGPPLPLSTGDGGLWTTATAFTRWLDSQNHDALGLAALTCQPDVLAGGATTDYGWGIGLRTFRGHALYIHGGMWQGASAKALRCPALGLSVVALTSDDSPELVGRLVDDTLAVLADKAT